MFSVSQKGEIFVRGKSIDKSSFGFSIPAPYKNSDHSDARATKPAMKKECDPRGGALGYFLGGYVPPGTPNWHPVLEKISLKIDTPF